jgi:Trk K+ transport system NAD-binding subunit
LFYLHGPDLSTTDSFYTAVTLLLGGYFDLLGNELKFELSIPWWLRLFGLLMTITGTVLVGAVYALITSQILAASFHFTKRFRLPEKSHVILIGWGRMGQQIAAVLSKFQQPFVVIDRDTTNISNQVPVIKVEGDLHSSLVNANLYTAKSVISVTNDEIANLELCLIAQRINPNCRTVLRMYSERFSGHVSNLLPQTQVLCSSALSAEAFVAAVFGENIPTMFVQDGQIILVTQYLIEHGDTLNGRFLFEIAFGFEVVPIFLVQSDTQDSFWMPSHEKRLNPGDQLTVLATIDALHCIEIGEMKPPIYELAIYRVTAEWAKSEGAMLLTKFTGCPIGETLHLMDQLPVVFSRRLYHHQGHQLVRKLRKMGFQTELMEPKKAGL